MGPWRFVLCWELAFCKVSSGFAVRFKGSSGPLQEDEPLDVVDEIGYADFHLGALIPTVRRKSPFALAGVNQAYFGTNSGRHSFGARV